MYRSSRRGRKKQARGLDFGKIMRSNDTSPISPLHEVLNGLGFLQRTPTE